MQGEMTEKAFKHLGVLMKATVECKKPSQEELQKFIAPISEVVADAEKMKDNRSEMFNHQSAFSEAIQCMNWVFITPAPGPAVQVG